MTTESAYIAHCNLPGCEWETKQPTKKLSMCLATWHVYEDHPDVWLDGIGNRPPLDPDPREPAVRAQLLAELQ